MRARKRAAFVSAVREFQYHRRICRSGANSSSALGYRKVTIAAYRHSG
jgi:hypothetical protein